MNSHFGQITIVETCAFQLPILEVEAERFDQMQPRAGVGTEPDDVAGVRRDLGPEQDDVKCDAQPRFS